MLSIQEGDKLEKKNYRGVCWLAMRSSVLAGIVLKKAKMVGWTFGVNGC